MKTLAFYTLFLTFTSIGILTVHAHEGPPHTHDEDSLWGNELKTFNKLIKTDSEAARIELQNFAATVFNEHILAEEWVPLYFRISRDGVKNLSDVKRVHELELRILTDIDTGKYVKQIQANQEALEYYTGLAELYPHSITPKNTVSNKQVSIPEQAREHTIEEKNQGEIAGRHFKQFLKLLPTDPNAARIELDGYTTILFQNHPLTEEWEELCIHIARDQEALITEIIRFVELRTQMLSDTNSERFAQEIKEFTKLIKNLKWMAKTFERDGILETKKIPFSME